MFVFYHVVCLFELFSSFVLIADLMHVLLPFCLLPGRRLLILQIWIPQTLPSKVHLAVVRGFIVKTRRRRNECPVLGHRSVQLEHSSCSIVGGGWS